MTMKAIVSAIAVFALVGCAGAPLTVKVPVRVACVSTVPVAPVLAYSPGSYTEVFPIVRDLKGDRELMLAYEGELLAVIRGCQ